MRLKIILKHNFISDEEDNYENQERIEKYDVQPMKRQLSDFHELFRKFYPKNKSK